MGSKKPGPWKIRYWKIRHLLHWQFLITYIFSVSLKILDHVSFGQVHSKECYFIFAYTFLAFCCCCFSYKKMCFHHFHFFFWCSIEFLQHNINQSETRIGDKKLSVELYVILSCVTSYHDKTRHCIIFSMILEVFFSCYDEVWLWGNSIKYRNFYELIFLWFSENLFLMKCYVFTLLWMNSVL